MQAHVRHVEKFTNFMSPVGLSISSHYNNSHPRNRPTYTNLTNPPHVIAVNSSGSDSEHCVTSNTKTKPSQTVNTSNHHRSQHRSSSNHDEMKENQWTRNNLSLCHNRNRSIYLNESSVNDELINKILDKLLIYGYETSADIAKMQPWELRILKKEIPQIDFIFMTAYRMWGKQEYYDDTQNVTFRQYWDPSVWLQYNEIELIIKCFDVKERGYQCMICGVRHGLYELDIVRWHIWLEHKNSAELNAIMQSSKKHNDQNFTKPLQTLQLPTLEHKADPQIISLLSSTDDEMEIKDKKHSKHKRYTNKARQYSSRRRYNTDNNKRRRSRRLMNKNGGNMSTNTTKTVQNPIIINGCNYDDAYNEYNNNALEIHGSQSPAFMPSVQSTTMDTTKNIFTLSGNYDDINDEMECDDAYNDMNEFNMIGFNDDFSTLGVVGALSRNSSDSFNALNGELRLNSAFTDPSDFSFQPNKLPLDSMNQLI